MRDFRDAKAMAQTLREALKTKSVAITHSESLELTARVLGFHDWNVLSARIQSSAPATTGSMPTMAQRPASARAGLPIVAMRDVVLFPQMVIPIFVGRKSTLRAIESAVAGDGIFLAVTQRRAADDEPALDDLYPVGVTATVLNRQTLLDGTLKFLFSCHERKTVAGRVEDEFLAAEVAPFEETGGDSADATALSRAVLDAYQIFAKVDFSSPSGGVHALSRQPAIGAPGVLADWIAPLLPIDIARKQQILETGDVVQRLRMVLDLLKTATPPPD